MVRIQKLKCCYFFLFHVIFPFLFLINFIHSIHTYCFSLIYIIFFGGSKHRHTRSPLKRWRAVCAKPLKTKSKTHANIKSPLPEEKKKPKHKRTKYDLCSRYNVVMFICNNWHLPLRAYRLPCWTATKHKCLYSKQASASTYAINIIAVIIINYIYLFWCAFAFFFSLFWSLFLVFFCLSQCLYPRSYYPTIYS